MNKKILVGLLLATATLMTACNKTCDVNQAAGTPGSGEDFQANVPNVVYFDFDSSKVSEKAKKLIEAQSTWLKTYSAKKVTLEGHCDKRGTAEYNMALGAARADATAKVLESEGVAKDRVSTVSYGKERLVDTGDTEEAHGKNRRVETKVAD